MPYFVYLIYQLIMFKLKIIIIVLIAPKVNTPIAPWSIFTAFFGLVICKKFCADCRFYLIQ